MATVVPSIMTVAGPMAPSDIRSLGTSVLVGESVICDSTARYTVGTSSGCGAQAETRDNALTLEEHFSLRSSPASNLCNLRLESVDDGMCGGS